MKKEIKVGLLGLGTVGTGVVKTLEQFDDINISKIAVRDINKKRDVNIPKEMLTQDAFEVANDKDIDILVEVIGGIQPAFDLIKTAIKNKKHIVTANKELVAKHGKELFELAKQNDVVILYEAAVAGGIPIIMPIKTALAGNKITKIAGILNGTTNFILTKMTDEGAQFNDVLAEAQELGYAEADPTGDVEGYDAGYKIAILASIAFNKRINSDEVYKEGISKIMPEDIKNADELGYKIKLIALAQETQDGIDARVHPMLVSKRRPIASIDGVLNAVSIESFPVGQVMFSGPGAGELPTASSVAGDIVSLAKELEVTDFPLPMMRCSHSENAKQIPIEESQNKYYINVLTDNTKGVIGELGQICGRNNINLASIIQKGILQDEKAKVILLTEVALEKDINKALEEIKKQATTKTILNVLRVMD